MGTFLEVLRGGPRWHLSSWVWEVFHWKTPVCPPGVSQWWAYPEPGRAPLSSSVLPAPSIGEAGQWRVTVELRGLDCYWCTEVTEIPNVLLYLLEIKDWVSDRAGTKTAPSPKTLCIISLWLDKTILELILKKRGAGKHSRKSASCVPSCYNLSIALIIGLILFLTLCCGIDNETESQRSEVTWWSYRIYESQDLLSGLTSKFIIFWLYCITEKSALDRDVKTIAFIFLVVTDYFCTLVIQFKWVSFSCLWMRENNIAVHKGIAKQC